MNERIRAGFSFDVDGTINRPRFKGPLSLLVPPPKNALFDTVTRRRLKEPHIPKDFDASRITEYIDQVSKAPGVGIIGQIHARLARVLNSDYFRPIKDEFPSVLTYNEKRAHETKNIDAINFILSGRPKNAQEPLLEQIHRYSKIQHLQLPRGKINSYLWKFLGGFELAKKYDLDVIVQFDDDIYAALSFVLMNQIPLDQLKTVAMTVVLENPSTKLLSREQRKYLNSLGIFFSKNLMTGAQNIWEKVSSGEYKNYKNK